MADRRRPRAKSRDTDSGFDVWIPALIAVLAAMFMIYTAHAGEPVPTAAPHAIYDASRFDAGAMDREAAAIAVARGVYAAEDAATEPPLRHLTAVNVVVAALPELQTLTVATDPEADAARAARIAMAAPQPMTIAQSQSASGLSRLAVMLAIGALLIGTLVMLQKTWRRTARANPI